MMNQNNLVHFVGKAKFYSKPRPATIVVKPDTLTIYLGFGVYRLSSNQVIALVPSSDSKERTIEIQHTSLRCPGKITFVCKTSPASMCDQIHHVGFIPSENSAEFVPREKTPIRWQTPLFFILIPMITTYIAIFNSTFNSSFLGLTDGSKIPMLTFLIGFLINAFICFSIRFSPALQSLILKPNRSFYEVSDEFNMSVAFFLSFVILQSITLLYNSLATITLIIIVLTLLLVMNVGHRIRALWVDGV